MLNPCIIIIQYPHCTFLLSPIALKSDYMLWAHGLFALIVHMLLTPCAFAFN